MSAPVTGELRVHLCEPGSERDLADELARAFPGSKHAIRAAGWLTSELSQDDAASEPVLGFARQVLPDAIPLEAESVSQWARAAVDLAIEQGDVPREEAAAAPAWRLHVFTIAAEGAAGVRRPTLVAGRIDEELAERRRRLLRRRVEDLAAPWTPGECLLQVGLVTPTRGYLSWSAGPKLGQLRHVVSRFPGGNTPLPGRNLQAPSRAFAKLVEAQSHLGPSISKNERCVDLGSSPGGWAYVALERGARVVAVDRSPLAPALMKHRRLEFVKGDAFRYVPPEPVDWLLCDVAAFPQRTRELIEEWLSRGLCRRFVVTVKFRGRDDYPIVQELGELVSRFADAFSIRRLASNKNEVTVMGSLRGVLA